MACLNCRRRIGHRAHEGIASDPADRGVIRIQDVRNFILGADLGRLSACWLGNRREGEASVSGFRVVSERGQLAKLGKSQEAGNFRSSNFRGNVCLP